MHVVINFSHHFTVDNRLMSTVVDTSALTEGCSVLSSPDVVERYTLWPWRLEHERPYKNYGSLKLYTACSEV